MNPALYCLCLLVTSWPLAAGAPAPRVQPPEEFLRQWCKAFESSKVKNMLAFYEDSADVTAIESTGRVRKGAAGVRKMYEEAFAEVVCEAVTLGELKARQSGDVAWATARFKADTVANADKGRWVLEVHASFVLKRSGDSWKIVLEHFSPVAGVERVRPRK